MSRVLKPFAMQEEKLCESIRWLVQWGNGGTLSSHIGNRVRN
jgi:hypothetical protein